MAEQVKLRPRSAWLFLGALLELGCSRSPDVVAIKEVKQTSDGGFLPLGPDMVPCVAGHYEGKVFANQTVGIQFSGTIDFTLVQMGSEIQVLQDTATLTGMDDTGTAMFRATIAAQTECVDGAIMTNLEDGWYQSSSTQFAFRGQITGHYNAASTGFTGNWSALLLLAGPTVDAGAEVNGRWNASLKQSQ